MQPLLEFREEPASWEAEIEGGSPAINGRVGVKLSRAATSRLTYGLVGGCSHQCRYHRAAWKCVKRSCKMGGEGIKELFQMDAYINDGG